MPVKLDFDGGCLRWQESARLPSWGPVSTESASMTTVFAYCRLVAMVIMMYMR